MISIRKILAISGFLIFIVLWTGFKVMVLNTDKLIIDVFVISIAFGIAFNFYTKKIEYDTFGYIDIKRLVIPFLVSILCISLGIYTYNQYGRNKKSEKIKKSLDYAQN